MPLEGYTPLFQRMLDPLRITVELGVDAVNGWRWRTASSAWTASLCRPVIYTGEVDELFSFRFGHLPYRTLDFDFETLEVDRFQPTATVNYTVSEDYTRITEYKQLTGQVVPGRTTIMKEYSRAYTGSPGRDPLLRRHQPGKQRPLRSVPGPGRRLFQPSPTGPAGRV